MKPDLHPEKPRPEPGSNDDGEPSHSLPSPLPHCPKTPVLVTSSVSVNLKRAVQQQQQSLHRSTARAIHIPSTETAELKETLR